MKQFGAYGLIVQGLGPDATDLVAAPPDWQTWTVRHEYGTRPPGDWSDVLDSEQAVVAIGPGLALIRRASAATTLRLPEAPLPAALAHPYLAATGTVAARWRGDHPLHAGAFVSEGRAWGVLGDREAGKSTMMAALTQAGAPILADDLVVLRGRTALAGPRTLDLREATARALDIGESIGVVGARERWRVGLDPVPAEVPLVGFVTLAWGDKLALDALPPARWPEVIMAAAAVLGPPTDLQALLPLFATPVWVLTRPRGFEHLRKAADLLLARCAGSSAG